MPFHGELLKMQLFRLRTLDLLYFKSTPAVQNLSLYFVIWLVMNDSSHFLEITD